MTSEKLDVFKLESLNPKSSRILKGSFNDMVIDNNLYKELVMKLKIIVKSKDKEINAK